MATLTIHYMGPEKVGKEKVIYRHLLINNQLEILTYKDLHYILFMTIVLP